MDPFPYRPIDLTHGLTDRIPVWDLGCGFHHDTLLTYDECIGSVRFLVQSMAMPAGVGTHIDSPSHCVPGAHTVEAIPLENLIVPLIVIDVHDKATEKYEISKDDVRDFEKVHGVIREGCFVAFYTGWSAHWQTPQRYHNQHVFPSLTPSAAALLLSRKIVGLGIDTLSPDLPSSGFPVHRLVLEAGHYIVENIANLEKMPQVGSYVLIFPLKGVGLTEAPVRMVGLVPCEK